MYSRSNRWKEKIYNNVQTFINIYIDNVLINSKYLFEFKKGGTLFDGNFELGSTPSQYIEFKIKKGLVQNPKKVKVEYGLIYSDYSFTVEEINNMMVSVLNNTNVVNLIPSFETIPIGTYNVDDYNDNDGKTTTIKALDNMIKFDADDGYYDASKLIKQKGYATLEEIAQDICNKKGVELGSTSFLHSNKKIYVYDNEVTAREYISYIAEQANCFAVIGRDGKLYFRQIGQDEETIPLKLFKTHKFGEEYKITKVAYENGIESFKFGNNTRNTLWLNQENLFIVDEEQVQDIYNNTKDLTINSFEGTVIIDPAIDIGDKIKIDGKTIIYQGEMILQGRFITDIKSTISIKSKEETTTRKASQKVINRRVQSRIDEEEAKITLLTEQNTENEEKISQLEVNLDGITTTVTNNKTEINEALQETKTELETKINVSAEGVESKVNKTLTNYSTTDETNTSINNAKTEAINTAGTNTDNKLKNYSTTTQMNSAITQKANEITTNVSSTYITKTDSATNINKAKTDAINSANTNTANKLKNYSTTTQMNSAIQQKADSITSTVESKITTAVNNIEIGGRNLVLNSDDYIQTSSTTNTSKTFQFNIEEFKKLAGKQIVISMDIELTNAVYNSSATANKRRIVAELSIAHTDGTTQYCDLDYNLSSTAETSKKRISTVIQVSNKEIKEVTTKTIGIYVQGLGSGNVKAGRLKVELGNKATDWTPAPEDTDTAIETAKTEIKQTTDSISTEVSKKVNNSEFGTKIQQNAEAVKIAWNNISDFIQFINAQLQIKDNNKKLLMVLDKLGQHFYNSNSEMFGEMGVKKVNNKNYIAFSVPGEYAKSISDGMCWGITIQSDGTFIPLLSIENFYVGNKNAGNFGGQLMLGGCDLVVSGIDRGIVFGEIKMTGDPTMQSVCFDTIDGRFLMEVSPKTLTENGIIDYPSINILDSIKFYANKGGSNSFKIGYDKYILMTDEGKLSLYGGNVQFGDSTSKVGFDLYVRTLANIHGNVQVDGNLYANNISSDRRIKKNIKNSTTNALDIIKQIRHKQFEMKSDNKHYDIGYIAQEMEEIDPNFVLKKEKTENSNERYYINELPIIATATKAIQEQSKLIEEMQKEIEILKQEIKELKEEK